MKRTWMMAAAVVAMLGLGMGCQKKTTEPVETGFDQDAHLGDVAPGRDSGDFSTGGDVMISPPAQPAPSLGGATGAGRIHVVQRGDTLYSLARQYYNDNSQWRRIYEANRNQIGDPNVLKTGQKLIIP